MFYITEIASEPPGVQNVNLHGPYPNHAKANGAMQRMFDEYVEELQADDPDAGIESDDSDASHFHVDYNQGDSVLDLVIVELSKA
jgi:hypothetical protein